MTFVTMDLPKGYRPMNRADTARLSWGAMVTILDTHDGSTALGHVHSESPSHVVVKLRGGAEVTIDRASAQSPDEQFAALTTQLADDFDDPNNAMAVALRASNEMAILRGKIRVQEQHIARLADAIQGCPTMEQYEAVVAELSHLRDDIRALRLMRAS